MAFAGPYVAPEREALATKIARLDRLSRLLDIAFEIPGTNIRFGVDAVLGLVPVVATGPA